MNEIEVQFTIQLNAYTQSLNSRMRVDKLYWNSLTEIEKNSVCLDYARRNLMATKVSEAEVPPTAKDVLQAIQVEEAEEKSYMYQSNLEAAKAFEPFRLALLDLADVPLKKNYRSHYHTTLGESTCKMYVRDIHTGATDSSHAVKKVPREPYSVTGIVLYDGGEYGWSLKAAQRDVYSWNYRYPYALTPDQTLSYASALDKFLKMLRARLVDGDLHAARAAQIIDAYNESNRMC